MFLFGEPTLAIYLTHSDRLQNKDMCNVVSFWKQNSKTWPKLDFCFCSAGHNNPACETSWIRSEWLFYWFYCQSKLLRVFLSLSLPPSISFFLFFPLFLSPPLSLLHYAWSCASVREAPEQITSGHMSAQPYHLPKTDRESHHTYSSGSESGQICTWLVQPQHIRHANMSACSSAIWES